MKIKYNEFVANPALRNTETNLPAHVAQVLIAQGVAVAVRYKNFVEYMNAEHAQASAAHSVNPSVQGVEWGIRDKALSRFSKVLVVKRIGAATTYFETPPSDCPPSIRARFESLTNPVSNPVDIEQERNRQYEQREQERVGTAGILYGSKK